MTYLLALLAFGVTVGILWAVSAHLSERACQRILKASLGEE